MRLAVSNIAWDVTEDVKIAALLKRYGVDAIDIAPGKYFSCLASARKDDIARVKNWWADRGIEITGMQALLFGATDLNIFGSVETQNAMLRHLEGVCRIGGVLGATRIVFGSPRNRDRTGLSDEKALEVATSFFRRLGDLAQSYEVMICLEPNPACYGSNFMMTSSETATVVKQVSHSNVGMQLDTGALAINGEDPVAVLQSYSSLIHHIHASEPSLVPLGDGAVDHGVIAATLAQYLPRHIVSIEMTATKDQPHEISLERALLVAIHSYRNLLPGIKL